MRWLGSGLTVQVLLKSEGDCLLVERAPKVYGFFDVSDAPW